MHELARRAVAGAVAIVALLVPVASLATGHFYVVSYHPRTETTILCAAMTECDVALQVGERVKDGFAADAAGWDPHASYSGPRSAALPHVVFRPERAGMRTNAVIPTDRRTYYLLLVSDGSRDARYYTFAWPRVFIARAPATPAPPPPTPAPDAIAACLTSERYSWDFDRNLPADHAATARTTDDAIAAAWTPRLACTDGRHTFVQFSPTVIDPGDLPVVAVLGTEGDTLTNYTYDARARRFRIDAVPERLVFLFGSQYAPLRLVLTHHSADAPGARR